MRRIYEKRWFGIELGDVAQLSESALPGSGFYESFYQELFARYRGYAELDSAWLKRKAETADWIAGLVRARTAPQRLLSIGCGIGYVEYLLDRSHGLEVHAADFASVASTWLRVLVPEERIHRIDDLWKSAERFDLIYLSGVDYAVPTNDLIRLLSQLRQLLRPQGRCVLITAEYYRYDRSLIGWIHEMNRQSREIAKTVLAMLHIRRLGQFWGWSRTPEEFRAIFSAAQYSGINDGLVRLTGRPAYFVSGGV